MKRLVVAAISIIILGSFSTPTLALSVKNQTQTHPGNLVSLAYQGYFQEQGIPSNGSFIFAVNSGKVTAESLINLAIAEGRLSPDTINNPEYVSDVEFALQDLTSDTN